MESVKQAANYVGETVGLTTSNDQAADSLDELKNGVGSPNTPATGMTSGSSTAGGMDTARDNAHGSALADPAAAAVGLPSAGIAPGAGAEGRASGLGTTSPGLPSSQALGNSDSRSGAGIVTTEDGRQTYAADGIGRDSGVVGTGSKSGLDAERIAGLVFSQPADAVGSSAISGSDATTNPTSSMGALGSTVSGANAAPGLGLNGRESASTFDRSGSDVSMRGNSNTGLDSTASGRNDINTTDRSAPSDDRLDPSATEGSAEVAAENPEMASKEMAGTTNESTGDQTSHGGHEPGGKHPATRENEGSIPTAGGEKLGSKHWGESKADPVNAP